MNAYDQSSRDPNTGQDNSHGKGGHNGFIDPASFALAVYGAPALEAMGINSGPITGTSIDMFNDPTDGATGGWLKRMGLSAGEMGAGALAMPPGTPAGLGMMGLGAFSGAYNTVTALRHGMLGGSAAELRTAPDRCGTVLATSFLVVPAVPLATAPSLCGTVLATSFLVPAVPLATAPSLCGTVLATSFLVPAVPGNGAKSLWNGANSLVSGAGNAIGNGVSAVGSGISNAVSGAGNANCNGARSLWNGAKERNLVFRCRQCHWQQCFQPLAAVSATPFPVLVVRFRGGFHKLFG